MLLETPATTIIWPVDDIAQHCQSIVVLNVDDGSAENETPELEEKYTAVLVVPPLQTNMYFPSTTYCGSVISCGCR